MAYPCTSNPFGLSLSKSSTVAWREPFDKLRANSWLVHAIQESPFGLSLSKPSPIPLREPFDRLRANGESPFDGFEMVHENSVRQMA
jgi:hypothetical protein